MSTGTKVAIGTVGAGVVGLGAYFLIKKAKAAETESGRLRKEAEGATARAQAAESEAARAIAAQSAAEQQAAREAAGRAQAEQEASAAVATAQQATSQAAAAAQAAQQAAAAAAAERDAARKAALQAEAARKARKAEAQARQAEAAKKAAAKAAADAQARAAAEQKAREAAAREAAATAAAARAREAEAQAAARAAAESEARRRAEAQAAAQQKARETAQAQAAAEAAAQAAEAERARKAAAKAAAEGKEAEAARKAAEAAAREEAARQAATAARAAETQEANELEQKRQLVADAFQRLLAQVKAANPTYTQQRAINAAAEIMKKHNVLLTKPDPNVAFWKLPISEIQARIQRSFTDYAAFLQKKAAEAKPSPTVTTTQEQAKALITKGAEAVTGYGRKRGASDAIIRTALEKEFYRTLLIRPGGTGQEPPMTNLQLLATPLPNLRDKVKLAMIAGEQHIDTQTLTPTQFKAKWGGKSAASASTLVNVPLAGYFGRAFGRGCVRLPPMQGAPLEIL